MYILTLLIWLLLALLWFNHSPTTLFIFTIMPLLLSTHSTLHWSCKLSTPLPPLPLDAAYNNSQPYCKSHHPFVELLRTPVLLRLSVKCFIDVISWKQSKSSTCTQILWSLPWGICIQFPKYTKFVIQYLTIHFSFRTIQRTISIMKCQTTIFCG